MKKLVLIVFTIFTLIGCSKKNDDTVDIGDQYLGSYNSTYNSVSKNLTTNKITTATQNEVITVKKGRASDEIIIDEGVGYPYTAKLSGSTFTFPAATITYYTGGVSLPVQIVSGDGSFTASTMKFTLVLSSTYDNQSVTVTATVNGTKK